MVTKAMARRYAKDSRGEKSAVLDQLMAATGWHRVGRGSDLNGAFCFTLTATDIATGWTENRTLPNRAAA